MGCSWSCLGHLLFKVFSSQTLLSGCPSAARLTAPGLLDALQAWGGGGRDLAPRTRPCPGNRLGPSPLRRPGAQAPTAPGPAERERRAGRERPAAHRAPRAPPAPPPQSRREPGCWNLSLRRVLHFHKRAAAPRGRDCSRRGRPPPPRPAPAPARRPAPPPAEPRAPRPERARGRGGGGGRPAPGARRGGGGGSGRAQPSRTRAEGRGERVERGEGGQGPGRRDSISRSRQEAALGRLRGDPTRCPRAIAPAPGAARAAGLPREGRACGAGTRDPGPGGESAGGRRGRNVEPAGGVGGAGAAGR